MSTDYIQNRLRQLLDRNLKPGTDKQRVLQFLEAQHIAHSEYLPELQRIYADIGLFR
jgi:hypothetical protein